MSATAALILLVEVTSACGAVAPTRPGIAADVVPAILDLELQQFERSDPTPAGMSQPSADVPSDPSQPEVEPAEAQCKVTPIAIA